MKVFITKYALSRGIIEANLEIVQEKYASGKIKGDSVFTREWSKTRIEAVQAASVKRDAKIRNMKKAITKLEEMKF